MQRSSLVGHVIEVLERFLSNTNVPADAVLRSFFFERKYLGSTDRRFISDSYFGIIRNYRRLEFLAMDAFEDPRPRSAEIVAAYCIAIFGASPEETQEDIAFKVNLAIDKLRLLSDRSREEAKLAAMPESARLAISYSYPTWFVERVMTEYGKEATEPLLRSLNEEAPTIFRTNTLVTNREDLREELEREGCTVTVSELAKDALISLKRVNAMSIDAFRRGAFEIQDEASQLVAPLAGITKTQIRVLDACAGAGGKTLHLAALLKNRGEIFATDVEDRKLEELKKRIRRSTAQNVRIVREADKARMLGPDKLGWFDLVLVDVPCTGTGTLKRNPGIKMVLTEKMLAELVAKQRQILVDNEAFVKTGGVLLYATCSLLHEEAEEQIAWFQQQYPNFEVEEQLRTRPDTQGCDGFYAARLRKKTDSISN